MKKWLGTLLGLILIIGLLAACGPEESEPTDTESGTETDTDGNDSGGEAEMPEKPEKLTVWVNAEEKQEEAVTQITDKYTEETGIAVELIPINMLDQVEKLDVEGPAGNGPDVIFQPHDRVGDLAMRGLVDAVDLGDSESQYTQTALDAFTIEGKYYAAPAVTETYALMYNKALIDEAPATMEELMTIAEEDTNTGEDKFGFLMEAANFYFTYPFYIDRGAYIFANENGNYDINDIGLNNEGAVEAGKMIQSWFENGYIPQDLTPDIMNGLFKEGKVTAVINGPWMVREYQDALGDDLGVATLPVNEDGDPQPSAVGVKGYLLSYYSENKEWATDLMTYITNAENSMLYYDVAGEIPAHIEAASDPAIADDPIYQPFAEQASYGQAMPGVPAVQQIWDPINEAATFFSKGEPVEEVLDEAVQQISDNIAASGAQ
ncbi:extracellular solute-binding protein [Aquibacillus rhizosphaerae]|uniref:Maltodextrin-binding protein n=1 Tax=Aquibacillus rhizosphaerae TaxID=3051431 RepID=A0ABT7LAL3_9BACI|nr:extracellular solute-binding protein [Aquibacillus sp. LR5S19]MDL4842882.1 extracellular solute-binding protein [Aquibacillus sp. LR5S19]